MRGGWVGSDVWDKVPKKNVFFYTFPYRVYSHGGPWLRMVSVAIPWKIPFRRFHFLRMDTCRYKVFFRKKKINARNNSFLHSLAFFTLSVYISTNAVDVSIESVINLQLGWKLWFTLCPNDALWRSQHFHFKSKPGSQLHIFKVRIRRVDRYYRMNLEKVVIWQQGHENQIKVKIRENQKLKSCSLNWSKHEVCFILWDFVKELTPLSLSRRKYLGQ